MLTDSSRQSPRPHKVKQQMLVNPEKAEQGMQKHDIVVVAGGANPVKDTDPELTKLNTIPVFFPIMRGSLNVAPSLREPDVLDKIDHHYLLLMCLRYQDHLRQLAEAVAFDQNALCIRIKEVSVCGYFKFLDIICSYFVIFVFIFTNVQIFHVYFAFIWLSNFL